MPFPTLIDLFPFQDRECKKIITFEIMHAGLTINNGVVDVQWCLRGL
ncbi:MAG: hypothetical protein LLG04_12860 [Parachlamydia sp.]|nr:hypothetical protein [Parachlamydia sp.]